LLRQGRHRGRAGRSHAQRGDRGGQPRRALSTVGMGRSRPARARARSQRSVPGARSADRRALPLARRAQLHRARSASRAGAHLPCPPARQERDRLRQLRIAPAVDTRATDLEHPATPAVAAAAEDELWYLDAIIYELHVKAFFDSNDDGIGDFRGLTQKLVYLKDLGVTAIWLLPFYPSPMRDDGYDVAD